MEREKTAQHQSSVKPWRDALCGGITVFLVTAVCNTVMYYYASRELLHELQEMLLHVARTAAVMTDGDLHQTFKNIDATDFLARMHAIRIPYYVGLLFAFGLSVLVSCIIYHIRKGHTERSSMRHKQRDMMMDFHCYMSDVIQAVTNISFKIDGKTAQIAGMAQTSAEKTIDAQRVIQGSSDKMQAISDSVARLLQVLHGLSHTMDSHANSLKTQISSAIQSTNYSQQMGTVMKNISGVVGIINDITDRIDLLSLNAAIEAARAGESGKGFMVVANEIKSLSAQASESAGTIAKHICDMDKMVSSALASMNNTSGLEQQVDIITQQTQTVITEQQEIVNYINEDIQDVTARALQMIEMVHIIAEMANDTGAKTMHMHKDVHMLHEQNSSLNEEVQNFITKL